MLLHPDERGSSRSPSSSRLTTVPFSPDWHHLTPEEALATLGSGRGGLTETDAAARLERDGPNQLEQRGAKSPLRILVDQLRSVMVLILIGAAVVSLLLGKALEAAAIGAIVVLFVLLGLVQEYRAERAIAALRRMAVPSVRLERDGRIADRPAVDLVPGDVVHLDAGRVVPADLRLIEVADLRVEEAALTGESAPVDKEVATLADAEVALGDRRNLAFAGTQVVHGRAVGLVVATGMDTQIGLIAGLLQEVTAERTPLQRRLDQVGVQLAIAGAIVAVLVMLMGAAAGERWSDLLLTAISVAVAVIPEGLPAVVTFTLAVGAQRMLRRQALIRKLPAVETLGSVTTICSDKTGTLTQNVMTVTTLDVAGERREGDGLELDRAGVAHRALLAVAAVCNDAELHAGPDGRAETIGDPTETALLVAADRAGIDVAGLRAGLPRIDERPFDSVRKRMSTRHDPLGGRVEALGLLPQDVPLWFVKGAVDGLLARVGSVMTADGAVPVDDEWRDRVLAANDELAGRGQRVLGVAVARCAGDRDGDPETDLMLLGLVGMIDPPRDEVRAAVATCRAAGIRPVMITGDHPLTAVAIARDLGIADDRPPLTGVELERLSPDDFARAVSEVSVFARVAPEHKLRIVEALQGQGQVVAMTGDGVNDAPALKRADIGVAMGITGTDVSKEAADMVLRDDNFATIVAAVEEGRVIYDNLRRFVSFAVAGNVGKILVMLGWPVPFLLGGLDPAAAVALLPLQLLWLNLMTDGLLGLSMGTEPAADDTMSRAPNDPTAGVWAGGLGRRTAWLGVVIGVLALGLGIAYHEAGRDEWQTMIFASLGLLQVAQALGSRSTHRSLFSAAWRTNPVMLAVAGGVVTLQLAAIYTPLRDVLDLQPLPLADLGVCIAVAGLLLALLEAAKWRHRRLNPI